MYSEGGQNTLLKEMFLPLPKKLCDLINSEYTSLLMETSRSTNMILKMEIRYDFNRIIFFYIRRFSPPLGQEAFSDGGQNVHGYFLSHAQIKFILFFFFFFFFLENTDFFARKE